MKNSKDTIVPAIQDPRIGQSIQSLLKGMDAGFDAAKNVKLIRHAAKHLVKGFPFKGTVTELYYKDKQQFLDYQQHQRKANFDDVEYIVSFLGGDGTDSLFIGVFKNDGKILDDPNDPFAAFYRFTSVPGFERLIEHVIIEWNNPRAWHQWYDNPMQIIQNDDSDPIEPIQKDTQYQQYTLNTDDRIRHTSASTSTVEAHHQRMQEGIMNFLENEGFTEVIAEADHVDIRAKKYGFIHFFEVKTYDTARACIREALGQILDYNHFPNAHRASKMYIVGPVKATPEELLYIKYLRQNYHLNIEYRWYSEDEQKIIY